MTYRDMPAGMILNRPEAIYPLPPLKKYSIVTGASGSLGRSLVHYLKELGQHVIELDKVTGFDLMNRVTVRDVIWTYAHDLTAVYHLAAFKDAPGGEMYPYEAAHINIETTFNVLAGAHDVGAKVVLASTGKAADPETSYGASKLICERMALNDRQVVGRFYNVAESGDNVFRYWAEQAEREGRIYVCDAWRYFISIREATTYVASLASAPTGRYAPASGPPTSLLTLAKKWSEYNGGVEIVEIPLRRGDRKQEPLHAASEDMGLVDGGVYRITCNSDPRPIPRKGEETVPGDIDLPAKYRQHGDGDATRIRHEALYPRTTEDVHSAVLLEWMDRNT